ncbi:multiple stress resistance protein BhsA [Musicola keenii]|uniref:multiple stress resistance protein BhsA n=1 Tax=Musicola keenii TaxID=2884250 RepID=UPI00177F04D0|nr:DUF1471 domain-containing protein [Musicola keenii]
MNSIKLVAAAVVLSTLSFTTLAATEVQSAQANRVGTVSASARSLGELQSQLAVQADAAGAKSYRIISATGSEQLRGVAELYK